MEAEILRLAVDVLSDGDFEVVVVSVLDHVLDLQFRIPGRPETFGAELPLVDSRLPMPFLDAVPRDEADFLGMARTWLEEEIATGCAEWAVTHVHDAVLYFEIAPYGFRHEDRDHHVELTESASGSWDNSSVAEEMRR